LPNSIAMSALEAIKYSDGKLQLLDQRLLPLETVYLDVPDPKAAWQQIKVRCCLQPDDHNSVLMIVPLSSMITCVSPPQECAACYVCRTWLCVVLLP